MSKQTKSDYTAVPIRNGDGSISAVVIEQPHDIEYASRDTVTPNSDRRRICLRIIILAAIVGFALKMNCIHTRRHHHRSHNDHNDWKPRHSDRKWNDDEYDEDKEWSPDKWDHNGSWGHKDHHHGHHGQHGESGKHGHHHWEPTSWSESSSSDSSSSDSSSSDSSSSDSSSSDSSSSDTSPSDSSSSDSSSSDSSSSDSSSSDSASSDSSSSDSASSDSSSSDSASSDSSSSDSLSSDSSSSVSSSSDSSSSDMSLSDIISSSSDTVETAILRDFEAPEPFLEPLVVETVENWNFEKKQPLVDRDSSSDSVDPLTSYSASSDMSLSDIISSSTDTEEIAILRDVEAPVLVLEPLVVETVENWKFEEKESLVDLVDSDSADNFSV